MFSIERISRVEVNIGCQIISFSPIPDGLEVNQRDDGDDYDDGTDLGLMTYEDAAEFVSCLRELESQRTQVKSGNLQIPKSGSHFRISSGFHASFNDGEYEYVFSLDADGTIQVEDQNVREETYPVQSVAPLADAIEAAIQLGGNSIVVEDDSITINVAGDGNGWFAMIGNNTRTRVYRRDKRDAIAAVVRDFGAEAGIKIHEKASL